MEPHEIRQRFAFIETRRRAVRGITLPMAVGEIEGPCVRGGTCNETKAKSGKALGHCAHCWQERLTTKLHGRPGRSRPGVDVVKREIRKSRDVVASIREAKLFDEKGELLEPELDDPEVAAVFPKLVKEKRPNE